MGVSSETWDAGIIAWIMHTVPRSDYRFVRFVDIVGGRELCYAAREVVAEACGRNF